MVGRWVLAPCPHHPILKVGMHKLLMGASFHCWPVLGALGNGGQQGAKHTALGADGACQLGCCGLPSNGTSPLLFQTTG